MAKHKSVKGLLIYFVIGIIAILSLYPTILSGLPSQIEQLKQKGIPEPDISIEALALLSLINPLILLIFALIIGFFTAHKVGLISIVIHPNKREDSKLLSKKGVRPAIILGSIVGIVAISFDFIFQSFLPVVIHGPIQAPNPLSVLTALLYGGIVEELLLRFGLMSLLVLIFWKVFDRKSSIPSNWVFILAILISALLFAIGHYGVTATSFEMTPFIWFRMLFLNGLGGLLFGWIYWKYNLELAMLSHMFAHIAMNLIILILSFFM